MSRFMVPVYGTRYHKQNILKTKAFTVSLADRDHMDVPDFFGIATGNKMNDKFERTGYTVVKSEFVNAPVITSGVEGKRYKKCLELMNVMAEESVLTRLSVQKGAPQYLMLARKSPYKDLEEQFPLYTQIEALASDRRNHIILIP